MDVIRLNKHASLLAYSYTSDTTKEQLRKFGAFFLVGTVAWRDDRSAYDRKWVVIKHKVRKYFL